MNKILSEIEKYTPIYVVCYQLTATCEFKKVTEFCGVEAIKVWQNGEVAGYCRYKDGKLHRKTVEQEPAPLLD